MCRIDSVLQDLDYFMSTEESEFAATVPGDMNFVTEVEKQQVIDSEELYWGEPSVGLQLMAAAVDGDTAQMLTALRVASERSLTPLPSQGVPVRLLPWRHQSSTQRINLRTSI